MYRPSKASEIDFKKFKELVVEIEEEMFSLNFTYLRLLLQIVKNMNERPVVSKRIKIADSHKAG